MRVRQPGVEGEHGDLDGEADEERQEYPYLERKRNLRPHGVELHQVEREGSGAHFQVGEVVRQNSQQHQHAAEQRIEEELDRRVELPRPAPHADEEVHRHQGDLEEHVEEENIERDEGAQHAGRQQEEADVVFLFALLDGGERAHDPYDHRQRREQDEQHADPVDADEIAHPDGGYPAHLLHELKAGFSLIEKEPQGKRNQEVQDHHRRGETLDGFRLLFLHEEHDNHRAQRGQEGDQRKKRHVTHSSSKTSSHQRKRYALSITKMPNSITKR